MGGRGLDTQRRRAGFFCVVALRRVGDYISERRHTARIRLYEALPEHTASASGMGGSVLMAKWGLTRNEVSSTHQLLMFASVVRVLFDSHTMTEPELRRREIEIKDLITTVTDKEF